MAYPNPIKIMPSESAHDIIRMLMHKVISGSLFLVSVPCHVPDAYRGDEYRGDGDCSDGHFQDQQDVVHSIPSSASAIVLVRFLIGLILEERKRPFAVEGSFAVGTLGHPAFQSVRSLHFALDLSA